MTASLELRLKAGRGAGSGPARPPPGFFRPTWAEVDTGALRRNLRRLKARCGRGVRLMFVAKGNAYGHGAALCCRAAEASGAAGWLGVSSVEEGVSLREAGLRLPILILGSLYPFESFLAAVRCGLTPTVASLDAARGLAEAARSLAGRGRVACHLKLDTGMGRVGMGWPSGLRVAGFIAGEPALDLEGVYTHLASADRDAAFTRLQLRRFRAALSDIRRAGVRVRLAHAANSAAALGHPASRLDMVRPGIAAYGAWPGFEPVLSLKTRIVFLKDVAAGSPIGYGAAFRTRRRSRMATVPIGYADGLSRRLSNRGRALVRGRPCPIVGTVTMDMTMLDVSAVPGARVGDEAVFIGRSGGAGLPAGELARLAGTIPYETLAALSSRVPRVEVES